jgi:putative copper resistance protein D
MAPFVAGAACRGLYYLAVMLLFGELTFAVLLRAKLPVISPPKDLRLRWAALALALATGLAWFVLAAWQMAGTLDQTVLIQTVTATLFGRMFGLRLLALLMLAPALFRRTRIAACFALVALVLPAATSHAAAASPAGFTVLGASLDALHLATAGFWIGGLAALIQLHRREEPNMLLALSLFSEWAMVAVLLLVMTGLINGASILLGDPGRPSPVYLAVLGAKLALVAVMLGLAGMNRFRLMPQGLDRNIARNAGRELSAGIIVVLLAGALGQLQPVL